MPLSHHSKEEGHHAIQRPPIKTQPFSMPKRSPPMYCEDMAELKVENEMKVGYGAGVFLTPRTGEIARVQDAPAYVGPRTLGPASHIPPVDLLLLNKSREREEFKDKHSARAMTDRSTEATRSHRSLPSTISSAASLGASTPWGTATPYESSEGLRSYKCLPEKGGSWTPSTVVVPGRQLPLLDWAIVARDLDLPLDLGPSKDILFSHRSLAGADSQASFLAHEELSQDDLYDYPDSELPSDDLALRMWALENVIQSGDLPQAPPTEAADSDDSSAKLGVGAILASIALIFAL